MCGLSKMQMGNANVFLAWIIHECRREAAEKEARRGLSQVRTTQASADSNGQWTPLADGRYTYRINTTLPADFDRPTTHTLGN